MLSLASTPRLTNLSCILDCKVLEEAKILQTIRHRRSHSTTAEMCMSSIPLAIASWSDLGRVGDRDGHLSRCCSARMDESRKDDPHICAAKGADLKVEEKSPLSPT